jgi:hypothetical protein
MHRIHIARCERLLPGEGTIDVQRLIDALPAELPIRVKIVSHQREATLTSKEWTAQCLAASRPYVETA